VIYDIIAVKEAAHARFDALKEPMSTTLTLLKIRFCKSKAGTSKLDIKLMNEAAMLLFNHIDFQCFSKVNTDVNTFDCTIFEVGNKTTIGSFYDFNRFLRNMVRSIVGTLVNVGLNKITLDDFNAIT
jgi:tRNA pseudouridine38-40 synthase